MSHRNRLFVFSLICLVHMGRWMKPVMFIRKVVEVIQVHLGWRANFISGCGGIWGFPTLHCLPKALEIRGEVPLQQACSEDTSETSLSFPSQSGAVECQRMSCPPLNCSPDSLPVHISGQCCKVCRRKYSWRGKVVLCSFRVCICVYFQNPTNISELK